VTALRLAHRGDWRHAPENSLAAMIAALQAPACDGLEFDVRHALDGVPIILHDATLARVQGLAVAAADLAAIELEPLGVPSLATVLAAAGPRPFLDIELKERPNKACFDEIETARGAPEGGLARAVISSFDPGVLVAVAEDYPRWPRWLNTHDLGEPTVERAVALGCAGIAADWRVIDARTAARVAAAGLTLAAFTVRRRSTAARLERLGVSAICAEGAALDG
jgi:glycerophosphoryl diester phosphodiesterase